MHDAERTSLHVERGVRRMKPRQRVVEHARDDRNRNALLHLVRRFAKRRERRRLDVLHHEEKLVLGILHFDDVDHRHDVRMSNHRRDARLVTEHVVKIVMREKMTVHALHDDDAREPRRAELPRDVHGRHAARGELEQRLVISESKRRRVRITHQNVPQAPIGPTKTRACSVLCGFQSTRKIAVTPVSTASPSVTPRSTFVRS